MAVNGFVLAYSPDFSTRIVYWARRACDDISLRVCDADGSEITARPCPTFERVLQIGERFFDVPRPAWTLAPEVIEPWRWPEARRFEERRLVALQLLQKHFAATGG